MIYNIPIQTLKIGLAIICYGIFVAVFLHWFRKKFENILPAFLLALLASSAPAMVFYELNPVIWFNESKAFYLQMVEEMRGGIVSMISVIVIAAIFGSFPRLITKRFTGQDLRSFYHLSYGIMICYFLFLNPDVAFWMLSCSISVFVVLEYLRESDDTSAFTIFIKDAMNKAIRGQEIRGYMATFFYLIGLILVVLFLPPDFALGATIILVLGDPAAAQIGKRYGRYEWNHNPSKSFEGSMAMFLVSFFALQILGIPLVTTAFVAVSATLFESLKLDISDNLMIPIISGIILVSI